MGNDWHIGKIEITESNFDPEFLSRDYLESTYAYQCYQKFGLTFELLQPQYILALDMFLKLEECLKNLKYKAGYDLIENYFSHYRPGKELVYTEWLKDKVPFLPNFGTPVTYNSMLIMREIFNYHVNIKPYAPTPEKIPYVWTIVLIGQSHGYHAESMETLGIDYGEEFFRKINPELFENDYKIIKDSFFLFSEFLTAITQGKFDVKMNFIPLMEVNVKCSLSSCIMACAFDTKMYFCTMSPGWENEVMFPKLSEEVKNNTDVYWVFYPDHRPVKNEKLNKVSYVTGGCAPSKIPILICHDDFLLSYFGNEKGDYHVYSDEERRAYLPQWLHHEFSHYLFNAVYKEYKLEVRGHDWHDKKLWPEDFEGLTEPDYFLEALNKRFKTCPFPIWEKLKWQLDISTLDLNLLCGNYEYYPVENDWHIVTISRDNSGTFWWNNKANVTWKLIPEMKKGIFRIQNDCPYFEMMKSVEINPILSNNIITGVASLSFGGIYHKK